LSAILDDPSALSGSAPLFAPSATCTNGSRMHSTSSTPKHERTEPMFTSVLRDLGLVAPADHRPHPGRNRAVGPVADTAPNRASLSARAFDRDAEPYALDAAANNKPDGGSLPEGWGTAREIEPVGEVQCPTLR